MLVALSFGGLFGDWGSGFRGCLGIKVWGPRFGIPYKKDDNLSGYVGIHFWSLSCGGAHMNLGLGGVGLWGSGFELQGSGIPSCSA